MKAARESKKKLDYTCKKLGLDEKHIDLALSNRGYIFIQVYFYFLFSFSFLASFLHFEIYGRLICLS